MQSSFSTFFFEFSFLDFRLDSIEFIKCMIWQSNPFLLLLLFFYDLSAADNDAYHRWLSRLKYHFSCRNCFERVIFWSKGCSCHFCPKKGLWLKSVPKKWTISFLVNVPQDINQGWFWNIMVLWLVFLVIEKEFAGLKL